MSLCQAFLVAACLMGVTMVLHGCGSGSGGGGGGDGSPTTTVIVMRHCVRATESDSVIANPEYTFYDNYTSQKWPEFNAPAMWCLPRGKKIIEAQGQWIRSQPGWLPLPLRAIADDISEGQRDNVTMVNLLKGLALDAKDVSSRIDHAPFANGESSACMKVKPSLAERRAAMQEFMNAHPPPPGYDQKMQRLYHLIGEGSRAANWTNISCTSGTNPWADTAMPVGACVVASDLVERLLMEWGGGMEPLGWGNVTANDIEDLFDLHAWQFYIWFGSPATYKWSGASITRAVAASIDAAEPGTTLYVGHDADIMSLAGALGLSWEAAPFSRDATLPGGMLRFDRDGDTITASYSFVQNFTNADVDGAMMTSPAHFSGSLDSVPLTTFQDLVEKGSVPACAGLGRAAAKSSPTALNTVLSV